MLSRKTLSLTHQRMLAFAEDRVLAAPENFLPGVVVHFLYNALSRKKYKNTAWELLFLLMGIRLCHKPLSIRKSFGSSRKC